MTLLLILITAIGLGLTKLIPNRSVPTFVALPSTPPSNPNPGDRWEDPSSGLIFRYIPKGSFIMGDDPFMIGLTNINWIGPKHQVTITNGFWMGETEVTQEQWERVMGGNPSFFDTCGKTCPVENVSWNDVAEFLEKISQNGNAYRLPTEAEWEYATRAGTTTEYWSGDTEEDLARVGWYGEGAEGKTHPVREKEPNKWGLYDVHGNVFEWTLTHWDGKSGYSEFAGGRTIDPLASPADLAGSPRAGRVVRGGSYWYTADGARSAYRYGWQPTIRDQFLGFRVLCPRDDL